MMKLLPQPRKFDSPNLQVVKTLKTRELTLAEPLYKGQHQSQIGVGVATWELECVPSVGLQ